MIRSRTFPVSVFYVVCDECETEGPDALTKEEAERLAAQRGIMSFGDKEHYCQKHWKSQGDKANSS